jgi:hypothetical protein
MSIITKLFARLALGKRGPRGATVAQFIGFRCQVSEDCGAKS